MNASHSRALRDAAAIVAAHAQHLHHSPDECPADWSPTIADVRHRADDLALVARVLVAIADQVDGR